MTKHVVEQLEQRQLLAVTIDNGLPATDPNYYQATIGPGGRPDTITWENQNVAFDYTALLDLGPVARLNTARVIELKDWGNAPVSGAVPGTATSMVKLTLDTVAPAPAPVITILVTVAIPAGQDRLVTSYSFSSTGYNLMTGTFFQYWNGISGAIPSDFVTVQGTVAADNVQLQTHNTATYNFSTLQDDVPTPNAPLTGFGVGQFNLYKPVIVAGGYVAPALGDFRIPVGNDPVLGVGHGPVRSAVTVLQYGFLSAAAAVVNTSLSQSALALLGQMQVNWFSGNAAPVPIPDGSTVRDPTIGVDFGLFSNTHMFEIKNLGLGDLSLFGSPIVQISGTNADAFHVTRQPIQELGGGGLTQFTIQYTQTQGGTQTASVSITSNDLTTTPYTFNVFGGSGVTVWPDSFEPDGPKSIDTAKDWATQFQQVKLLAKVISTQDVGQTHSISSMDDVDWVKFFQTSNSPVAIETFAPIGNTRLYLFDSNGKRVAMNNTLGTSSRISLSSLAPGTYYVRIDEAGNNALIPSYNLFVRSGAGGGNADKRDAPDVRALLVYVDANHKLWVWGNQNDNIIVDISGTSLRVIVNSNTWYFPLTKVSALEIRGDAGSDAITVGAGVRMTIVGGSGNDTIISSTNNDTLIYGGAASSYIQTGNGNNTVYGGDGNDTIIGGSGNDSIEGGAGDDQIHGGAGNDTLKGGDGNDTIYGDAGDDIITGDAGDDSLYGGDGNDTIDAGDGRDYVQSDAGIDQVTTWYDGSVDTILANTTQDILNVDDDPNGVMDIVINSPI